MTSLSLLVGTTVSASSLIFGYGLVIIKGKNEHLFINTFGWVSIYKTSNVSIVSCLLVQKLSLIFVMKAVSCNFGKRAPGQNWKKISDLTSKLGKINDIEHNKGSKIYLQNQVILDCIMPSIPLKHQC